MSDPVFPPTKRFQEARDITNRVESKLFGSLLNRMLQRLTAEVINGALTSHSAELDRVQ
jgi:hypothetical protein